MNNTDEQKRNIKNNTMYNFIPIFEKKSSEMEHFLRKVNFQNWLKNQKNPEISSSR